MTLANARKITGMEIVEIGEVSGVRCFLATPDGDPVRAIAEARGKLEAAALKLLVDRVYRQVKLIVFQEQGWKCAVCLAHKALTAHHLTPRSSVTKGRDDRRSNLIGVDMECHQKIELGAPVLPRAEMLDRLLERGWRWDATVPVWRIR